MNQTENTEPAPVKKKHRGCLFLLLGLMAAVLLLVLSAAFLLLEPAGNSPSSEALSVQDWMNIQQASGKVMKVMMPRKGKTVPETAVIVLTAPELNSLLRIAVQQYRARTANPPDLAVHWTDGALQPRIRFVKWGLALNLELTAVPDFQNGRLTLRTRSCRAGRLPISPETADSLLADQIEKLRNDPKFKAAAEVIQSVKVRNDGLELTLRPKKIGSVLPLLMK